MFKFNHLVACLALATSIGINAAEPYDRSKNYSAGSQVTYNGKVYEAQWWANPNDSPANVTAVAWESPWILISEVAGGGESPDPDTGSGNNGSGNNGNTEIPSPDVDEDIPPLVEGDFPLYSENTSYKGGDIVQNAGKLYQCKMGVTVPWCSGASWAYAPGTGTAWQSAWDEIASDTVAPPPTEPDTDKPGTTNPPPVNPDPDPEEDKDTGGSGSTGGTVTPQPPIEPPPLPEPQPEPEEEKPLPPGGGVQLSLSKLNATEQSQTDFPLMREVKNTIRTLDNKAVEQIRPKAETNPANVKRVESIISEDDWNYMFPKRTSEYTYRNFLQATGKFPAFCQTYTDERDSDAICRRALASMFAHFTQETGGHTPSWDVPEWRQGLVHVREMGWDEQARGGYNGNCGMNDWQSQKWPCGKFENGDFKSYFGRGAKQLSYNFNYGPFSEAMFGTPNTLLDNPDMVADTWLNLASAIFFFLYPQPPKPSMMHVIDGTWQPNEHDLSTNLTPGFGVTTQIINGGLECNDGTEKKQSLNRIDYFRNFANYLEVDIPSNERLGCADMKLFDAQGAGAINIYWEKDWGWSSEYPGGGAYNCKLVSYQTAYSAFVEGDFVKCIQGNFPDAVIIDDVTE